MTATVKKVSWVSSHIKALLNKTKLLMVGSTILIRVKKIIVKRHACHCSSDHDWEERKKAYHDVGISVDKFEEFFQAPKTTFEAAKQEFSKGILGSCRRKKLIY